MRKFVLSFVLFLTAGSMLTSCGLFRGGKSEKCPAYTSVGSDKVLDITEMPENQSR